MSQQPSSSASGAAPNRSAPTGLETIEFGPFRLDLANALLSHLGQRLDLPPKVFAVLGYLAQRPGQLVRKEELLDAAWGHRFVSGSVLKNAISAIRSALGDDARAPRYVETASRLGYRFVARVAEEPVRAAEHGVDAGQGPWVARDSAFAQLARCLDDMKRGAGGLMLIGGEAGVGKTTLINRSVSALVSGGVRIAFGQCVEQSGGGEPFLPVLDALAALARGPEGAAWREALARVAPSWLAGLPWLHEAQGRSESPNVLRMPREFGALLDATTQTSPLVLVLEDLHWADHATVDLIGYLARRRGSARAALVGSFRPIDAALNDHPVQALRFDLRARGLCREVLLEPFSEKEVGEFLRQRLTAGQIERGAELARALNAHTEGLPLFLDAVVQDLLSRNKLCLGADEVWRLAPEAWRELAVPASIGGLIARNLGRLSGEDRRLLEVASIIGSEFADDVLAAVLAIDAGELRRRCEGLVRQGEWLTAAGLAPRAKERFASRYGFRHALYQRVLINQSSAAERLSYHLAIARGMRELDIAPPPAADLAQHYEAAAELAKRTGLDAGDWVAQGRQWRLTAGRQAKAIEALADALEHYRRAFASPWPAGARAEELAARIEFSEVLRSGGYGGEAMQVSQTALAQIAAIDDAELARRVKINHARLCIRGDRVAEGMAALDDCLAVAGVTGGERAAALALRAEALRHLGDSAAAAVALDEALASLSAGDQRGRADILAEKTNACFECGRLREGLELAAKAQALYEAAGQRFGAAQMLVRQGVIHMNLGERAPAFAALELARERMQQIHDVDGLRRVLLNLVKLHSDDGDAGTALALLDEGWDFAPDFETPVAECAFLSGYYYCHYLRGELGKAWSDAEKVLASAAGLTSIYWRVGSTVLVSDFYCHVGAWDKAQALIDAAVGELGQTGEQVMHTRLLIRRAWLQILRADARAALHAIEKRLSEGPVENAEDETGLARVHALALLSLRQAAAARNVLEASPEAPTREVLAMMLALRIDAGVALSDVRPQDLAAAEQELTNPRLPALEGLVLRHALARAEPRHRKEFARRREILRASLGDLPGLPRGELWAS